MSKYVDICQQVFDVEKIKDFKVVPVEYIFRPVYEENVSKAKGFLGIKGKTPKLEFITMEPYAAVIGENNSNVSEYKSGTFVEAVAKDVLSGVATTIGDALKLKAAKSKKYKCVRPSGAKYNCYLEDIPILIYKEDGREFEIKKSDNNAGYPDDCFNNAVKEVRALKIESDKVSIIYGNGIQCNDIDDAYERLKLAFADYKMSIEMKKREKQDKKPSIGFNPFGLFGAPKEGADVPVIEEKKEEVK